MMIIMNTPGAPVVPLADLHFGQSAKEGVNARTTGRDDIKSLANSLKAAGLIVPLTYQVIDNKKCVVDGNRRLAAIQSIIPKDKWRDFSIPAVEIMAGANGLELSMIANVERADLHPVDRYWVFSGLVKNGKTEAEIAATFMLTKRQVVQALALGRVHSSILEAWRADKIDAETVEAYTVEPDQERQAKVFRKLKHSNDYAVRRELLGDQNEAEKLLQLVGLDAYQKAGGAVLEDLFADKNELKATDIPLLEKLAEEKLAKTVERLTAEGWKWVERLHSTSERQWYWDSRSKGDVNEKDRGKYGVLVAVNSYSGALEIKYGVTKPSEAAAKDRKKAKAKGEPPPTSNALAQRLSETLTLATADAMLLEPSTAIAALLAGFASAGVVKVSSDGLDMQRQRFEGVPFDTAFKKFAAMSSKEHCEALAKVAAGALDMRTFTAEHPPLGEKENAALCNYLDPKDVNTALRKRLDFADYFNGVSKDALFQAVNEAMGKDHADKIAKMTKGEAAKFCMAHLPKAKWLPPELRVKGYDGPGAGKRK